MARPKRVLGAAPAPAPVPVEPIAPVPKPVELPILRPGTPDVIESIEVSTSPLPSTASTQVKSETEEELTCPICSEKMMTLSQLNRHLDDEHFASKLSSPTRPESPAISPIPQTWLKRTNEVRTKLQALPKIFDTDSRTSSNSSVNTVEIQVTRRHWQKPSANDTCSYDGCRKVLSMKNGIVNCRKCGRLFCHDHTVYRVKLDAEARYDIKGVWSRCCQGCFEKRPGYNDFGLLRDDTSAFKELRQRRVDDRLLYQNKLEKRVVNLATAVAGLEGDKKKQVEQQIVTWQDSKNVLNCFLCLKNFTFMMRKHHCRLCGRVVCADLTSGCSMEVPINKLTLLLDVPRVNSPTQLRMCGHCKDVLFQRRNFQKDLKTPLSPLLEKFEHQQTVKRAVQLLMPRFQDVLHRIQQDSESKSLTQEASKLRKRLVDAISLFDKLTKEIIALQDLKPDEVHIQNSIKQESSSFIQQNTAPLKQLSRLLETIETPKKPTVTKPKFTRQEVQQIKQNREQLMVLQEQKFLVEEMIENCKKQRRFDEIAALNLNLKELEKGISDIQMELGDEGFSA